MKEILTNSWVVSIVSGIFVFLITNIFVIVKNKSKAKKQIYDANMNVLNHIRGYVVDNGLPSQRIIEAVKRSVAREYNIKYADLLSTKNLCEELVKDIIGNSYISNENKKYYINMLEDYLKQNESKNDTENPDNTDSTDKKPNKEKRYKTRNNYIPSFISIMATIITVIGVNLFTLLAKIMDVIDINSMYILIITFIAMETIIYFIKNNSKWQ